MAEVKLEDFLGLDSKTQLGVVDRLPLPSLLTLWGQYKAWAEVHLDGPVSLPVLGLWLERLLPSDYNEGMACASDPKLAEARENLTPEALKRVRTETYDTAVRDMLNATPMEQQEFVASLDSIGRSDWTKLLNRYANQYGRSKRVRELEAMLKEK